MLAPCLPLPSRRTKGSWQSTPSTTPLLWMRLLGPAWVPVGVRHELPSCLGHPVQPRRMAHETHQHGRVGAQPACIPPRHRAPQSSSAAATDADEGAALPIGELLNVESEHPYVEYDSRQWLLRAANALPGSLEVRFERVLSSSKVHKCA